VLERDDLQPQELWTCSLASGTQQQLTQGTYGFSPVWTRKGVYFSSVASGNSNLSFIPSRGGSTATQVRASEAQQWLCAAAGGGSQLLYQELDPETGWDLWRVDLEGGEPTLLLGTPAREASCALDTDETWLAFESAAEGSIQVYVTPYPGVQERINVSQGPGAEPRWSQDGSELYFLRGNQLWAVSRPAAGADWPAPRPLFTLDFASDEYDTLPDGRFLAVERVDWDDTVDVVVVENWFEELKRLVPVD
jgi:Tol biopolymer transport system component